MQATTPSLPNQTNRHFLTALVDLSAERDIEVSEDIYSEKGIKLLARGTKVCPKLYGQVVNHKLLKPIETSLAVADMPDLNAQMCAEAERLLDELPLLRRLSSWSMGAQTPLSVLANLRINAQAQTLLAVAGSRTHNSLRHNVLVSLIAMGLANALRYNDQGLITVAAQGGMFHDVGEVYVDPEIVNGTAPLSPQQWMSYGGHVIIGAALAREIGGFDVNVQRAVLEHHERRDGFGYPRNLQADAISVAGRILGMAEMLSALMLRPSALKRIDIAIKIMPAENEPEMVSFLSELLRECADASEEVSQDGEVMSTIHDIFLRIALALSVYEEARETAAKMSRKLLAIVEESFARFVMVQRAFTSTGVSGLSEFGGIFSEEELRESQFEASCVLGEVAWRMLKLSRELCLTASKLPPVEGAVLMSISDALAGTTATGTNA